MARRVTIDISELRPLLERHTAKLPGSVRAAVERVCLDGLTYVTKQHLSHSKDADPVPTGLRAQSGQAKRSVRWDVAVSDDSVVGRLGSPHRYVRAHELGFTGKVQVPSHIRMISPLQRNTVTGKVSKVSAKAYKAARAKGRKTTIYVRAHSRQVNMAARLFFKDTVKHVGGNVPKYVLRALRSLADTGVVPQAGSL